MKKILLQVFAALFFAAYLTAAQAEAPARFPPDSVSQIPALALSKVSFEDKEALVEEMRALGGMFVDFFTIKTSGDNIFAPCAETDGENVIKGIGGALCRIRIVELFEEHNPYLVTYFTFEDILNHSKTEKDFLESATAAGREKDEHFALLLTRYKAAFKAVAGVFEQAERSLPKEYNLSAEQENIFWEKFGYPAADEKLFSLPARERELYKKIIAFNLEKTNFAQLLDYLKPYTSALFGSILINDPQLEKVAREAINSVIKINRKELDKTIKEVFAGFDKKYVSARSKK